MTADYTYIQHEVYEGIANGIAKAMDHGIAVGRSIGKVETTRQIAENLKLAGMPLTEIRKATGLSINEIKQL